MQASDVNTEGSHVSHTNISGRAAVAEDNDSSLTDWKTCQIFWCDKRAFEEAGCVLKDELETKLRLPVTVHKTADKCIRLLQKEQRWKEQPQDQPRRVFLVSWANAPVLAPYLAQSLGGTTKLVVLCDTCRGRVLNVANGWAQQFSMVDKVTTSWREAIDAVTQAVATVSDSRHDLQKS